MSFFVESFDEATHTSKIIVSKNISKSIAIGDYFYVRKTENNTLEISSDGTTWNLWIDLATFSTDFKFLMTGPVAKPSNLLGSVDRVSGASTVSTDIGTLTTVKIDAEYNNSSYDDYLYTDEGIEHFNAVAGFVYSGMTYIDWSMGYQYIISMGRTVELSGYKIYLPDGTTLEEGEIEDGTTAPVAPENLTGERTSGSSITLEWDDKSLNENGFEIERKAYGAPFFIKLTEVDANINTYADNTVSEDTRYEYRVRAVNDAGESDYSNELAMNLYGVPEAPWDPSGGYNSNMNYVYLMWWARYSDNISYFKVAYLDGSDWVDLSFDVASDPDNVYDDKWLQSTQIYYNQGQAWPAGTHKFKVKAINSYGESYYSEVIEVNPYGKKAASNDNPTIDYTLFSIE